MIARMNSFLIISIEMVESILWLAGGSGRI